MFQENHDYVGHFRSKIVFDHFRFQIYWPKMAIDICEYIWGCLFYAKWAMSAQSVLLTSIQTRKLYEFIGMDFIDLFEKFAYDNTYIYNLVN